MQVSTKFGQHRLKFSSSFLRVTAKSYLDCRIFSKIGGRWSSGIPSMYTKFDQNRAKTENFLRAMLNKGPSGQSPPARVDLSLLAPAAFSPSAAPVLTEAEIV